MPHYKITYRPLQGGWLVFDADRTTYRARITGDEPLPVVFVGGFQKQRLSADMCDAWMAIRRRSPILPLKVFRDAGRNYWWVCDAEGHPVIAATTKAAAQALRRFILSEVGAMSLRQSQGVPA